MTTTPTTASDLTDVLAALPLKTLDPGGLVLVVLDEAHRLDDAARVRVALHAATFLHRHQTRASRAGMPRTPYVEHPLRNALRLLRWGVTDTDVVVAAILHDVIEDCAPDIVRHGLSLDPHGESDSQQRSLALGWVSDTFGAEVARLVAAVSNPLVTEATGRPFAATRTSTTATSPTSARSSSTTRPSCSSSSPTSSTTPPASTTPWATRTQAERAGWR